jgi:hypothetical protein
MNAALSTFLFVYLGIGTVALGAVVLLASFALPRFPNLSPAEIRTAQLVLLIVGARAAIAFPMSVFGSITTARQRFALTGSIAIVVALVQGAATYLLLRAGYGLVPLVGATTLIAIASYGAYIGAALVSASRRRARSRASASICFSSAWRFSSDTTSTISSSLHSQGRARSPFMRSRSGSPTTSVSFAISSTAFSSRWSSGSARRTRSSRSAPRS